MSISIPVTLLDYINNNSKKKKQIFSERKKTFVKEYLKMNNISISSSCSVKTDYTYKYGHLTLYNSKLTINQYESNKIKDELSESYLPPNQALSSIIIFNDNLKAKEDILYPIFFIDFNMVTCQLVIHKTKQKFRLIILGKNITDTDYDHEGDYIFKYRIVKFKMDNVSQINFNLVCESINKSIILSNGYRNNIFSINIRKNFCTEYFINHKEFALKANTGDILLFRGYAKESHLQRVFTNADYDHVAVLFRKNKILYVYESTGKDGVKLRPWSEFITYLWYLLYEKMVFRHLKITEEKMKEYILNQHKKCNLSELIDINGNNSQNIKQNFYDFFNKKVNDFIEHTEDKKYSFSKSGYVCDSKMRNNTLNREGYSCSELVAACYYYSEIITDDFDASNFLPGFYSRGGNIPFKPGFSLGEEYIIDFSTSYSSI